MSRFRFSRRLTALAATCAAALLIAPAARAQSNAPPEEFTAFGIYMGQIATGATQQIILNISRWSSDAEQEQVMATLKEKGQQGLISLFRKGRPVGTIRTPHSVGYDLQLAYQEPAPEGGRRIIIATDRPIGFAEATARPQSMDYPFSVVEILMPKEGTGQGTLSLAARFVAAGKRVIVENFDTAPVQLNNVQARVTKK